MVLVTTTARCSTIFSTTVLVTTIICCSVVWSMPACWALRRSDWMVSISSFRCSRNACPSATVQSRSASILAMSSGNFATASTFSSHGCASTFGMLFVSFTNRAAMIISTGYTDAGKMIETKGSGCSAMGIASFSSSAALRLAGADGGGAGVVAGGGAAASGTAPRRSSLRPGQKASRMAKIGFINASIISRLSKVFGPMTSRMSFPATPLELKQRLHAGGERSAGDRAKDRHPSVAPVAITFARDWKKSVREPWAEIARGVDRVTRGAAERESDGEDEHADWHESETAQTDHDIRLFRANGPFEFRIGHQKDRQDEAERADEFAKKRLRDVADVRRGAEAPELAVGVVGHLEMLAVVEEDQRATGDSAEHLRDEVTGDFRHLEFAGDGHRHSDCRVQMRAAEWRGTKRTDEDGESPPGGNDDPAGIISFGAGEEDVGNDAVAEENKQRGPDEFCEVGVHSVGGMK